MLEIKFYILDNTTTNFDMEQQNNYSSHTVYINPSHISTITPGKDNKYLIKLGSGETIITDKDGFNKIKMAV